MTEWMRWKRWALAWVWVGVVVWGSGCADELYHGLSEREANEMVVVLEQHGLRAGKVRDGAEEGRWVVTVNSGTRVRAWQVLEANGLPPRQTRGFDGHYPTGGLIPTGSEERILEQYATAEELKAGLLKIGGVVDAHVNLVMPEKPDIRLRGQTVEPPRASVLVKYRGDLDSPPVSEEQIRDLVAGGVERLEPSAIRVMRTPATRVAADVEVPEFASVGPIAVSPASKGMLQVVVGGLGLVILTLGSGIGWLMWRRKAERSGAVRDE